LLFAGLFAPLVFVWLANSGRADPTRPFCVGILWSLAFLLALAFFFRLRRASKQDVARLFRDMLYGVALLGAAVLSTWLSLAFGAFSFLGHVFFAVPTGLYLAGFFFLMRAMNPNEDRRQAVMPEKGYTSHARRFR
jgi:hypothetical protein